jgi:hypothetical protein
VARLGFPDDQIVGTLDWPRYRAEPVLASGVVTVPDGVEISLNVNLIESVRRTDTPLINSRLTIHGTESPGEPVSPDDSAESWEITGSGEPADLAFLRQLPGDAITNLHLQAPIVPGSFAAVTHLTPGLRRLYLGWTDLTDDALDSVSQLRGLVYLQTWSNQFTDHGVQQLAALTELESLYLEEETLTAAAFAFAARLPRLTRLGLQDVPITADEVAELRLRLPGVGIG